MSDVFIGEIKALPYTFAPRNWAWCNGQLVAISQNTALFSLLSTTYGGDGRTTFGMPNLKGRTPIHYGQAPGLSNRFYGSWGGRTSVALLPTQIPSHTHTANASTLAASDSDTPATNRLCHKLSNSTGIVKTYTEDSSNLVQMSPHAVSTEGQSMDHENRQPFFGVKFFYCP
jgi:microcystin-dependent protein